MHQNTTSQLRCIIVVFFVHRPRQSASFDVERHEFLCPLCKGLSNAVLPILPYRSTPGARQSHGESDINVWLEGLHLLTRSSRKVDSPKSEDVEVFGTLKPAELEAQLGPEKFHSLAFSLATPLRPRVNSSMRNMASLFVDSVYTVRSTGIAA